MGVVYRARDPHIDRLVAIKTISMAEQEEADEQQYRERFAQEARAAGRLAHPGIVTVFDAGEDPETHEPFLVMEYVAGKSLGKMLSESGGRLPLDTALRFACEIADALGYAHSQGVIHRDIKPSNILITEDVHAKITDFGVAALTHGFHTGVFGSPAYMAPEQLSGARCDARSDLFSLGVVLYSMLTGFRPFQGNSAATVCFKVLNVEPVPVTSFQPELPPGLDAIVSRAIAKDPNERYRSGAEMANDIRAFVGSDSSMAQATQFFTRVLEADKERARSAGRELLPWRRFLWQAGCAVVLAALILTGAELRTELREAAAIAPPAVPVPLSPRIDKTPPQAPVARKVRPRVSTKPMQPAAPTTSVLVEILHHFSDGKASIWIDKKLVLTENLHDDPERHPLFRTVEMNEITSLQLAPGKHKLEVRVIGAGESFDQTGELDAELRPGLEHVLYVNCDRRKMQLSIR
jgi:hypothetical protein